MALSTRAPVIFDWGRGPRTMSSLMQRELSFEVTFEVTFDVTFEVTVFLKAKPYFYGVK